MKLEWSQISRNRAFWGNYFFSRQKDLLQYWWRVKMSSSGVEGNQKGGRSIWSQCPSLSQTQCILCYWQGWLLIICLCWLPSEEKKMQRCSLTLEGHWSQELLISTGERLHPPPRLLSPVSHCAWLKTDRDEESCLCSAQRSGSLSWRDGVKLQKAHVIEQLLIGYLETWNSNSCDGG